MLGEFQHDLRGKKPGIVESATKSDHDAKRALQENGPKIEEELAGALTSGTCGRSPTALHRCFLVAQDSSNTNPECRRMWDIQSVQIEASYLNTASVAGIYQFSYFGSESSGETFLGWKWG